MTSTKCIAGISLPVDCSQSKESRIDHAHTKMKVDPEVAATNNSGETPRHRQRQEQMIKYDNKFTHQVVMFLEVSFGPT